MARTKVELYNGLIYELPMQPVIAGYDLPKKQQKWRRTELPANWDELPLELQEKFAFEEDRKCTEGIWFFNNGVPTYINGDHYHYLSWFELDSGYPQYRDRDRRWFYHAEICLTDENCIGQAYGKLRRDGYSYRVDSIILNRARKTFNAKYGIVSKTGEDAKEMFNKLVHAFLQYPSFFKPQVQAAEDVKKALIFKTPQQRVTFKSREIKKEISLNTVIDWRNTKQNAYDGNKEAILAADETGKWEEVDVEKWFNIGKTCLILGGRIIGKMFFGSTVNESKKGGAGFLSVWNKSDHRNKTENNRTISGLFRYFVSAVDGLEGFIDEFGNSVIETPAIPVMGIDGQMIKIGAREFLENELSARKNAGDMVGYYEFKRQFPITEEDMFIEEANEKTVFDLDRIHEQIEHNNLLFMNGTQGKITRGNFEWENGIRDTKVVFRHSENGRWLISWMPPADKQNNKTIRHGKHAPVNAETGLFSLDPFSNRKTVSNKNSKAASHGLRKFDLLEPDISNCFVTQYWARPSDPFVVYEDMIMQCVFYGWPLFGENNKNNWYDYFVLRGYELYAMDRPAFTYKDTEEVKDKDPGLANFGEHIRNQLVEHLQSHISNQVGKNQQTGKIGNMPFQDTLKDWLKFDVSKWTDYDLTVSSMLVVVGSKKFVPKKTERKPMNLFQMYSNKGMVSVRVEPDKAPVKK